MSIWLAASLLNQTWLFLSPPIAVFFVLFSTFYPVLSLHECLGASFPLGYILVTWTSFIITSLLSLPISFATTASAHIIINLVGFVFLIKSIRKVRSSRLSLVHILIEFLQELPLNIFLLFSLAYFGFVFHTHTLWPSKDGAMYSGGAMWADLAFHLNVISSFKFGINKHASMFQKPLSPIYSGHTMSYPFIPDLHCSILLGSRVGLRNALLVPSLLTIVGLIALMFCFVRRFLNIGQGTTKSKTPRNNRNTECVLGVLLWLLSGSIGAWTMIRDKDFTVHEMTNHDWMQFTSSNEELFWFSVVSHVLLPQRSALFAYPIALLIFSMLIISIYPSNGNEAIQRPQLFKWVGILLGLLPLVHAHSFVAIAIVISVWALIEFERTFSFNSTSGLFSSWFKAAFIGFLLSLPQIPSYLDRIQGGDSEGKSFLKILPLWEQGNWAKSYGPHANPILNFAALWFKALGLMIPLSLISFFLVNQNQRKVLIAFYALFAVSNVVMFQPWEKDNNKMFIIWLMAVVAAVSQMLVKIWRRSLLYKPFVIVIIFSLVISGVVMGVREANLHNEFISAEDQEVGRWVRDNTPYDAVFLSSDSHIHPVTNIGGRAQVYGYPGWTNSHGYPNLGTRYNDVRKMLQNPSSSKHLFKRYNISFIAFDPALTSQYHPDEKWFLSYPRLFPRLFVSSHLKWTVLDVRPFISS